jgi:hypothetical protein
MAFSTWLDGALSLSANSSVSSTNVSPMAQSAPSSAESPRANSTPRGMIWETGTAVKAHDWFVIPLALGEHRL